MHTVFNTMTDPTPRTRRATGSSDQFGVGAAGRAVAEACAAWRRPGRVLVIGIDGHGASGKSTIARHTAAALDAALISGDDFFADGSPGDLATYYDWPRLRRQALEPLRAGRRARFVSSDPFVPGRAGADVTVAPATVVVLEGVGAGAPQLADLVDRAVLVQTPEPVRLARLKARIDPNQWDAAWLAAERSYFESRPASSFDLIVCGAGGAGPDA